MAFFALLLCSFTFFQVLSRRPVPQRLLDLPLSDPSSSTANDKPLYNFDNTPVLLVTAFFPLPSSKHTSEEYGSWLKLFLSQIRTPMVIYTSPAFSTTIKKLRGDLPAIIDTNFTTPFDVPTMHGLEGVYARQHDQLDPERSYHNPSLYATWNSKAWLLQHASETYGGSALWFFWNDAGALRETHTFAEWPDMSRVQTAFYEASKEGEKVEDLVFIPIWDAPTSTRYTRNWKVEDGPIALYKMSEGECVIRALHKS